MDHRVLCNGLKDHFQDLEVLDLSVRRDAVGKQAGSTDQLDLQVGPDQFQFFPDRDDIASLAQDRPVIPAQMRNHGGCGFIFPIRDQAADVVQTVVEKMRIDLGLKHFQLVFFFPGLLLINTGSQLFDVVVHHTEALRQKSDLIPGMYRDRKVKVPLPGFVRIICKPDHRAHDALGQQGREEYGDHKDEGSDDQKEQGQVQGFLIDPVVMHHINDHVAAVFCSG